MQHSPFEDFLSPDTDSDSPGARLYLYRILHLASIDGSLGQSGPPITYQDARRLADRLGLDSPERLGRLFYDLGLGTLQLRIETDFLQATLVRQDTPGRDLAREGSCKLERGLIDGALAAITGMPVTTAEGACSGRGHPACIFEARLDDSAEPPRFVPAAGAGKPVDPREGSNTMPGKLNRTGLKTWFMDLAARELARSRRHGRSLSVIYVDLDDLGEINAQHGRPAGDQVISAVAASLSKSCRTEDFLWYNGEDEFALVLAETDSGSAEAVARRLSTEIFSAAEYVDIPATVSASIGFSTFPTHADSLAGLFKGARSAVYLAKSRGKGRAQVSGGGFHQEAAAMPGVAAGEPGSERRSGVGGQPGDRSGAVGPAEHVSSQTGAGWPAATAGPTAGSASVNHRSAADAVEGSDVSRPDIEQPASILVALSSPLLIAGMREVVANDSTMTIVKEVTDPSRLAATIADLRPDLIFGDLHMFQSGDHESPRMLRRENLPCKCIVFVNEIDQEVIRLVADFQVDGVLLQSATPNETIEAMRTIYRGRTILPPEVMAAMGELESNRRLLGELSDREVEVLRLVAEGKSNSQISEDLFITVNTVRFHLANIYQKLSVSNRTEAANYFLRQDLAAQDGQTKLL